MHPIVLLLIAGTGAYFLYDAMEEEPPEVQALKNKDGDSIIVPTRAHHKHPRESLTDVPPLPDNGPQAIVDPPPYRPGPHVNVGAPVFVNTRTGAATNYVMQSVEDMQRAINVLGHGPVNVSGRVDPTTQLAVARLQRSFNLPETGAVDLPTRKRVEQALAHKATAGAPVAAYPSVQEATVVTASRLAKTASQLPVTDVVSLQRALNALGANPPLKLDGVSGKKTTAAIKAFQIASGLVADGVARPKTLTALQAAVDPKTMQYVASSDPGY